MLLTFSELTMLMKLSRNFMHRLNPTSRGSRYGLQLLEDPLLL